MKRGFTLLELIVVIIIIGILATLAVTQYGRFIERSRSAEARMAIGAIRTNAAAFRLTHGNTMVGMVATDVGIGTDFPGPAAGNCAGTHYFWYNLVGAPTASGVTILATRCLATGKLPQGVVPAGTVQLATDLATGVDTWTTSGAY